MSTRYRVAAGCIGIVLAIAAASTAYHLIASGRIVTFAIAVLACTALSAGAFAIGHARRY